MSEMSDFFLQRHCFRCHKEINHWGTDSLGVLVMIGWAKRSNKPIA